MIRIQPNCKIEVGNLRIFESVVDVTDRDIFLIPETEIIDTTNVTNVKINISNVTARKTR